MIRYFFKVVFFVYERKSTIFCFYFEETSYLLKQKICFTHFQLFIKGFNTVHRYGFSAEKDS
jgi:hypothetical protein